VRRPYAYKRHRHTGTNWSWPGNGLRQGIALVLARRPGNCYEARLQYQKPATIRIANPVMTRHGERYW
jgi:hypothetical protein